MESAFVSAPAVPPVALVGNGRSRAAPRNVATAHTANNIASRVTHVSCQKRGASWERKKNGAERYPIWVSVLMLYRDVLV